MQSVSCTGCQALQRRLRDLQAENERLRRQLDAATRAGKRQAALFAKGQPAAQPKKPGRKPDILVDCVLRLVQKEPSVLTGQALLDEDFLRAEGVTDFSGYACVPGTNPPRLSWAMAGPR